MLLVEHSSDIPNAQSDYALTVPEMYHLEWFTFEIVPKLNVTVHENDHSTKVVVH